MDRIKIENHGGIGILWLVGWLFTTGYLGLGFWRAVLAFVIWPYELGLSFAA